MLPISSERLVEIIHEEIRRALGLLAAPTPAPAATVGSTPVGTTAVAGIPELPVVVAFNGAPPAIDAVVAQLRRLREAGVDFSISACSNFAAVHHLPALAKWLGAPLLPARLTARQAQRVAHQMRLLIWASVSENTTNRLAAGIADTVQSDLIARALRTRRPVIASAPDLWARGEYGYSRDPLERLFRANYATLERWGIQTVETGDLARAALETLGAPDPAAERRLPPERPVTPPMVLTLGEAQDALRAGQTVLRLAPDARLTDLAREFIEQHNMRIERA